jgi:hypothetical protein
MRLNAKASAAAAPSVVLSKTHQVALAGLNSS